MITKTKAACGSANYQHAKSNVHAYKDNSIISNYNRGAFVAGIIIAISFGLMMLHAAVVL